jgi:hypothetical protein
VRRRMQETKPAAPRGVAYKRLGKLHGFCKGHPYAFQRCRNTVDEIFELLQHREIVFGDGRWPDQLGAIESLRCNNAGPIAADESSVRTLSTDTAATAAEPAP